MNLHSVACGLSATLPATVPAHYFVFVFEFRNDDCNSPPLPSTSFQVVQNMTFISRFNDSELSKMDMGPLWAEILESEKPFNLFSAHDSTVYPLMTTLGERVWNATDFPAYASMMLIEVGDAISGIFLFSSLSNQ